MTNNDLETILKDLKTIHPDLKIISTNLVAVADWVRLKCRYGCKAYGKHLCCPPYSPTPEETRRVLSEYNNAILVRFEAKQDMNLLPEHIHHALWDSLTRMHRIIYELERKAFLCGFHKAFGIIGAFPVPFAISVLSKKNWRKRKPFYPLDALKCRHKDIMRPSMEACGIDVFRTLENAGYSLTILKNYAENLVLFGMVLLD